MIVSSQNVKNFLLDVINKAQIPGQYAEFVAAVKAEVVDAQIAPPQDVGGIDQTASDRMMSHKSDI